VGLVCRQRGVDRDHDQAQAERGVIGHGPLGAALRQNRDPVAKADAPALQLGGRPADRDLGLTVGQVLPAVIALEPDGVTGSETVDAAEEDPGQCVTLERPQGNDGKGD
jgi:hypothetical protein